MKAVTYAPRSSYAVLTTKMKKRVLGLGWNLAVRADEVTPPSALRLGSNPLFEFNGLHWRSPESGGMWYK